MNATWRKVARDAWFQRTRALLVVLAIALGVAAFSAVMSSYAVLTRELNHGYLATDPASIVIRTDRVDDAVLRAVRAVPGVAAAEPRRTIDGRIKVGPIDWRSLRLFVLDDYRDIRVSRFVPESGAWPPARGEMLIERDAFQVARAGIGQSVTVRTTQGGEHMLRIAGGVHDVGRAQARMEQLVYGYISPATLAHLGFDPHLDRVNVLVADNRYNEAHIEDVAADVRKAVESTGHPVNRVEIPAPGKHPHSNVMQLLLLIMAGFGLLVLFVSCVLVINLLTAMLAAQVRQIGVMKALGGTPRQIARIYFAQVLLLGVAALAIGIPIGAIGKVALCRYLAVFLNFDITSFAVPAWVYGLVAFVGLAAPLLAAARPIRRGTSITVRAALADFGVPAGNFGVDKDEALLARIGGRFRPVLLAVRNSFRHRDRLRMTVNTLVFAGLFFMAALNLRSSMFATIDNLFSGRRYDLSIELAGTAPYSDVQRAIAETPGIARAEGWFAAEGRILETAQPAAAEGLVRGGAAGDSFTVFAIPPNTSMMRFEVSEGRALTDGDTDAILVNNPLAGGSRLHVGDQVTVQLGGQPRSLRVVGRVREPFSSAAAYVPQRLLDAAHPGMVNDVHLAVSSRNPDFLNRMKLDLERNLAQRGIRTADSASKDERRRGLDEHFRMIYAFLVIVAVLLALVGGLGLSTTMSLNVMERRREMGVMRAIGATPRVLAVIVMLESTVVALMSWAIATAFAWPVTNLIGSGVAIHLLRTRLNFRFDPSGVFLWLAASLVLGALASFVPAWDAARCPVREAVSYE